MEHYFWIYIYIWVLHGKVSTLKLYAFSCVYANLLRSRGLSIQGHHWICWEPLWQENHRCHRCKITLWVRRCLSNK